MAAQGDDAEILALSEQIEAIEAELAEIDAQIGLLDAEREAIRGRYPGQKDPRYIAWKNEIDAFDAERGLKPLFERQDPLGDRAYDLTTAMWAIPAKTPAGRQAKVKRRLADSKSEPWCGPESGSGCDLDYHIKMVRRLLGEFAGMTEEELAHVPGASTAVALFPQPIASMMDEPERTHLYGVVVEPPEHALLDAWIANQPKPRPSRAVAINRLFQQAMHHRLET
ncbi:hypothetical protein SAMN05519103_09579 [Rhizobiales bacterium GAS113]|nr:hypothetical protein SAMN05519103_09579 [Rhizobiales bacterium GAS113]